MGGELREGVELRQGTQAFASPTQTCGDAPFVELVRNEKIIFSRILNVYGYEVDSDRADKREKVWTAFFNQLVEFKKVHGRLVVSKQDYDNRKLYSWVTQQRKAYRQGSLPAERKSKLVEIGFIFQRIQPYQKKTRFTERQEEKWDKMYASYAVSATRMATVLSGTTTKATRSWQSGSQDSALSLVEVVWTIQENSD